MLIVITFSYTYSGYVDEKQTTVFHGDEKKFQITITEPFVQRDEKLVGKVKTLNETILLSLTFPNSVDAELGYSLFNPGMTCSVGGELEKAGKATNENAFDYEQYLKNQAIHWVLHTDAPITCDEGEGSLWVMMQKWRQQATEKIQNHFGRSGPLALALILGDRNELSSESENAYRRLGVIHLLAISGLHVGLISGMCYYMLLRMGLNHRFCKVALLILLPAFVLLTGASPPVVRACLMVMILSIASLSKGKIRAVDALCVSFLGNMFFAPRIILDPGFQLSYCVCFTLILSSATLLQRTNYVVVLFKVSLISTVASYPILLFHFYEISLVGLFTNLLYVPLFSFLLLPLCYATFLLLLIFFPLFELFHSLLEVLVLYIEKLTFYLSSFPYSTIILGKPSMILIILDICFISIIFLTWEKGKMKTALLLGSSLVLFHLLAPYISPKGEVVFLDVGQGDCIYIRLPYNRGHYLIDTGGAVSFTGKKTFDIGESVVIPFLKSKGVRKLDKLILTHSDYDHIGGSVAVLKQLEVSEVLISPSAVKKDEMKEILKVTKRKNIPVNEVKAGENWSNRSGRFNILSPFDDVYDGNNDSLVVYGEFGGKSWLFTGDLEEDGERQFLQKWMVNIDVLKVGHHGSNSSSTAKFLEELSPEFAIISAGRNNRFGHPHKDVLKRLQSQNTTVYTTAKSGAISYVFFLDQGTFYTVLP